jgi:uncharacterized protein (DUF1800 family)
MRYRVAALLVFGFACSHAGPKEPTAPVAADAPAAASLAAAAADPAAGPPLTPEEQIEHVLARTAFGARPADRDRVARIGIPAYLEEQLHPQRIDDARVEAELKRFPALSRPTGDLARELSEYRKQRQEERRAVGTEEHIPAIQEERRLAAVEMRGDEAPRRGPGFQTVAQLAQAKIVRAVDSERQLQEVMADFWFNHFNVFAGKMNEPALLPEYDRLVRERALGKFGDLLDAVAHSPAMLVYLDNWRSSVPGPRRRDQDAAPERPQRGINENYARELLELHTMGVDGGYTQDDVVQVARCFTGWTVAEPQRDPRFVFRPQMHDFGPKTVLGISIPPGRGEDDGRQVLALLVRDPATARFIARKLARRFVSDDPPRALVERAAATFLKTDGDIRSVLRTIFESSEFWSRRALRAKVRSPLELVAGSLRALGVRVDDPLPLAKAVARMGEPLYAAQPPTGYLDSAEIWLSPGALLARIDFGLALAQGQLPGVAVDLGAPTSADAADALDRAARRVGAPPLSETTRTHIVEQLRAAPAAAVPARAVGLLLGAPEMQRR